LQKKYVIHDLENYQLAAGVAVYLLDDDSRLIDAEFSLATLGESPCVIVESSGGANPSRDVKRRNPDYNNLLNILLQRLSTAGVRIIRIVLDSNRVTNLSIQERTAQLDCPYPVDLSTVNIDAFRIQIGRVISMMHRAPDAKAGGNAQKRIRMCLDRPLLPEQLLTAQDAGKLPNQPFEHAPGLTETEVAYIQKARRGQGTFRIGLLAKYHETCPIFGISNADLLLASHIKPWAACTNQERLDPDNGILLSALIDRLFDRGLVTFGDDGSLFPSQKLSDDDRHKCNLQTARRLTLSVKQCEYMAYHRTFVYKRV
jgi:hypothetical protein